MNRLRNYGKSDLISGKYQLSLVCEFSLSCTPVRSYSSIMLEAIKDVCLQACLLGSFDES